MRTPSLPALVFAVIGLTLAGLVGVRVSAQQDDSPTDHPPIVVPASTSSSDADRDEGSDDNDDKFEKISPRPRNIDDDDDDVDRND